MEGSGGDTMAGRGILMEKVVFYVWWGGDFWWLGEYSFEHVIIMEVNSWQFKRMIKLTMVIVTTVMIVTVYCGCHPGCHCLYGPPAGEKHQSTHMFRDHTLGFAENRGRLHHCHRVSLVRTGETATTGHESWPCSWSEIDAFCEALALLSIECNFLICSRQMMG